MANSALTTRFAAKFILGCFVLIGAFEASRGTALERILIRDAILVPTTTLINVASPGERTVLIGRTITSARSRLHVTRGCEGIEMLWMLLAAILAFPASWSWRLWGLLLGSALAYLLSVGRLITLHYLLESAPSAWGVLHGLILPLAPVIIMTFYFMRWAEGSSSAIDAERASGAA